MTTTHPSVYATRWSNAQHLTLHPLAERWVEGRRQRGEIGTLTATNHRYRLAGLVESFGARPIEAFGPAAIRRWQTTIGHLSPATRRSQLSTIKCFAAWLHKCKLIRRDPTLGVPRVRQPRKSTRALPEADVAKVLRACPDARARAIVWLMVGCGLRCLEVSRLEVGDYDHKARTLYVVGKGGHERTLPVPAEAARALDNYLAEVGRSYGPLIRSQHPYDGRAGIKPHTVAVLVGRWIADAGIKRRSRDGVSAHALRHTAASDVLAKSKDLRVVQEMLGHAHLSSTSIYLRRASLAEMRKAMEGRRYRGSRLYREDER